MLFGEGRRGGAEKSEGRLGSVELYGESSLRLDGEEASAGVRGRAGRKASGGGAARPPGTVRCCDLSASAAVGGRLAARLAELDAGLAGPSDAMDRIDRASISCIGVCCRGGRPGAAPFNTSGGACRSWTSRLYDICLFLSPLRRLKMIARISGR